MKQQIVPQHAGRITYEIREIVEVARELAEYGTKITWENIGDPVRKGEEVPVWIKEIIVDLSRRNSSYAYSDTQGEEEVRTFLASVVNARGGCRIAPRDILFFNGLGDAIGKIFSFLDRGARVLGPSPGYSAISSVEAAHADKAHLVYHRSPENGWLPDLDEIERTVRDNPSIVAIAFINPDNPTGSVMPRDVLEEIVRIAREHGRFLIADETYANITYNGRTMVRLSDVIGDAPGIALRSISKEYPWPGARCGWIEAYNKDGHEPFRRYIEGLVSLKRLEVCSTTLPQLSIPVVYADPRFALHCAARNRVFEARSHEAFGVFVNIHGAQPMLPCGAFYFTVTFDQDSFRPGQSLPVAHPALAETIEKKSAGCAPDKRFAYYLLASTGICVVPLTGFSCDRPGFRITLLEHDDSKRRWIYETVARSIEEYLAS